MKRSFVVHECHQCLEILRHCNNVTLLWVHGHYNIFVNGKADEPARMGSEEQFIGPEPYIGIAFGTLKHHIKCRLIKHICSADKIAKMV